MTGTVKEYDKTKSFGLRLGQPVVFELHYDMKGDKAVKVRPE